MKKWLWLLLLIPLSVFGQGNVSKISFSREGSVVNFLNVLFITATYGDYICIYDYVKYSKFTKYLKVKSLSINLNTTKGSLSYYENIIKERIGTNLFDFVIVLDESAAFSEEFYQYLKTNIKDSLIKISYRDEADIRLFIDFSRFFNLINDLNLVKDYTVYYLHNKDNPVDDLYYAILSNTTGINLKGHTIDTTRELQKLLDKCRNNSDIVIISNLDKLFDDVSGKIINQVGIIKIVAEYNLINLNINHNQDEIHIHDESTFDIFWSSRQLSEIIDNIVTQRRLKTDENEVYILSSKFNINLSLDDPLINAPDVKNLKSILEYTDYVILKD